ncbi:putative tetratricopeptide-like helical domain-containing protein [Rosa chinensis]|uniref:Putative tetratricopeptide-like helical domain-containing protein n=1 Tax=Rosa chinensis TaxID=74649 RepID=A0A2P6PQ87_ROSCH|nr:pentatricopeptide repeat-containing protein At1g77170, mitochondrial isoform X1 [Rosa chinensis]XP_040363498.1 pentatricopeptide repeat-containing protein At1g77170, mitochondrial isoform X1 [Rosa chinensis]XP_040363499.1 pentatricopeptide repeat-containing protein At1g77170, mitochondrial isoform X1 [Rosa chinensis]XP_040363500.1 pentatricopeptide repeat-containing protein At1g77170, mitochondrial isoform X1 [Rosa chinensis]PRQ24103.1 putative tetratricopeptide-like helical domain-containin
MSNYFSLYRTQSSDFITRFIHHISQTKNQSAVKKLHAHLLTTGLLIISPHFHAKLILSYTKCLPQHNLQTLTHFFKCMKPKSELPFNVLMADFCRNGFSFLALKTLSFMHSSGVPIDTYALCSSLTAASSIKDVGFGRKIHAHVVKSGWCSSVFVGSALIDLYAKSLVIGDAGQVFDEMPLRNTVCANALLSGYGDAKLWTEAVELIRKMPALSLEYDHFTLSAALRACAGLAAVELGRQVHGYLMRSVYDVGSDVFLLSSLIEMYGKCGLVAKAQKVFNFDGKGEGKRDVVMWTSLLGVCGRNGYYKEVLELFKDMLMEGISPDGVAFVTVISACARTGQLQLGIEYFESMELKFSLKPGPEHYSCLVDLLCRAGELGKAWKLIDEMLNKGHSSCTVPMWGALLNACKDQGDVELGKLAAQWALELNPHNDGIYVLLSNLYARFGMWHEINHLRELMKEKGLRKDVGYSHIEVTN